MITPRQEFLLAAVINTYLETGEPVSSKHLEGAGFMGLSSATIRAEMNDLENAGHLAHLYTSSGRIPTQRAYRYFVDNLMSWDDCEPDSYSRKKVTNALEKSTKDPKQINKTIAYILAEISDNMVMTNIHASEDFVKVGIAGLFESSEFKEIKKIFQLISFFDEFENIFEQLERRVFASVSNNVQEIRLFIGEENPWEEIQQETAIFARYDLPDNCTGSMTIIGPMRMDYKKNIGLVKYTVEEVNKIAKKA